MECPQCHVQIQGKSLTRNSSYSTMVQCITKIRNLLNGIPNTQQPKDEAVNVLMSILDGVTEMNDTQISDEIAENVMEPKKKRVKEFKAKNVEESRTAVYANTKPKPKSNSKTKSETDTKLELKTKPEACTKLEIKTKPEADTKLQLKTKPAAKSKSDKPPTKESKQVVSSSGKSIKRYGLLLTGLSEDQKAIVHSNLQDLSKIANGVSFRIIKDYTPEHVTHIICACAPKSHCPRTLKYLLGIAGKSWIVSFDWILESIESGKILKEDRFVVTGDEAVKCDTNACEKSRADPGKLFTGHEFYLQGSFTFGGPSKTDLTNLIQLSGGSICKKAGPDSIIISDSQEFKKGEYPYTWLFDAISCYELRR